MKLFNHCFYYLVIAFFIIFSLYGCVTQRETFEIIEQTELPIYEGEPVEGTLDLRVLFHVLENGSVADVRLITKSEDENWNAAVVDSMKKWRFSIQNADSSIWVQKNVKVHLLHSRIMNLGEITLQNQQDANIIYSRLQAGVNFQHLLRQIQDTEGGQISGRYLEDVDTSEFPTHVSRVLLELEVGGISRPVHVNGTYIIYKRFSDSYPS